MSLVVLFICFEIALAEPRPESLQASLEILSSNMKARSEPIEYEGVLEEPRTIPSYEKTFFKSFSHNELVYKVLPGSKLVSENTNTGARRKFSPFDIAIKAGWYLKPKKRTHLPSGMVGVFRQSDTLWMGTNGVGILSFNLNTRRWTRFDVKDTPVPGHHMWISWADDEYVFVDIAGHPEVPQEGFSIHSLDVYSIKKSVWLVIKSIPGPDVISLGYEDSRLVSMPVDYRGYQGISSVPPLGNKISRLSNADYSVKSRTFSNGSRNEQILRKELLAKAFEESM